MKSRLSVFISVLFLCLFLPKLSAQQEAPYFDPTVTISMDFQDANLKDVIKVFSIQSGLNFIASEALQDRKTTLYLDKVPIQEAMDKIFRANNLSYELDEDSNIFIVKDWGKPQIETVTKIFRLRHATVSTSSLKEEMSSQISSTATTTSTKGKWAQEDDSGITRAVKKLLSEYGSIIEDFRTNSLIITDIPSRMPTIEQTIALLDVPVPQVMLEVEMLDVSKNVVDKLGFDLSNNPITLILPGSFHRRGAEFFLGDIADRKKTISDSNVGGRTVLGSTFAETLDFLRTRTDTKYLARPRLLTLNNETAEIKIATQESIGVSSTTTAEGVTTATPERSETGVTLRVTPQVNLETGEITMFIYPRVAEAIAGNTLTSESKSFVFRDPEERSTKTMVKIKDGETVIIGGLIRNEFSQVTKKLPILGDIPIIGALFRHKGGDSDKNKERELLVFITPHIVKDASIELAQAPPKKVTLPNREQDTVSRMGRQTAIGAALNNLEKKKK